MSDDVDSRVSPALHPGNVRKLDGYDEETASLLGPVETAFSEAYLGIGAVHDARDAAAKNPTWNEAQQLIQVDDFAAKQLERCTKRFDAVAKNLYGTINSIETELSAPVESKASHGVASEIRRYVSSLPDDKRLGFVQNAIRDDDDRTATAVLGAPGYLSGFSPDIHKTLTRLFHEHHNPLQAKRLRAAQSAVKMIGDRAGMVFPQFEKAIGASAPKIKQLRMAKSAAEKHFVATS